MIIEKILKQLTPEWCKKEVELMGRTKLPHYFLKWLREYNKFNPPKDRNKYLWKWLYRTVKLGVLPIIDKKYKKSLPRMKILIILFVALLDDIPDRYNLQNKKLLNELLKVPFDATSIKFNQLNQKERGYVRFTIKVFRHIKSNLKKYPRYKEFRDIFEYDITQFLNTIRYSYLVNKNPCLMNKTEYWVYLCHNMQIMISVTVDLMCSSRFNIRELGIMREIVWEMQKMARVNNWITTWEREVKDRDFTSGVFPYAISSQNLNFEDILKMKRDKTLIKKIKKFNIEKMLLKEWERGYWKIERLGAKMESINVKEILKISEILFFYHWCSRGLI